MLTLLQSEIAEIMVFGFSEKELKQKNKKKPNKPSEDVMNAIGQAAGQIMK